MKGKGGWYFVIGTVIFATIVYFISKGYESKKDPLAQISNYTNGACKTRVLNCEEVPSGADFILKCFATAPYDATREQIRATLFLVLKSALLANPKIKGISIFLCPEELCNSGYVLGKLEYADDGSVKIDYRPSKVEVAKFTGYSGAYLDFTKDSYELWQKLELAKEQWMQKHSGTKIDPDRLFQSLAKEFGMKSADVEALLAVFETYFTCIGESEEIRLSAK